MKVSGFLFAALIFVAQGWAGQIHKDDNIQFVKDGPVHESFIIQEFGQIILQYVPNQPPEKITELIPQQDDPQAKWIPGYWAWSKKHSKFLWVSGVWRRPPPTRVWISGYWKQDFESWVWIRGFWSDVSQEDLTYIPELPPDAIDEKVANPPSPEQDYFWVPGYWRYDASKNEYVWYSGRWEMLGGHWVYVPAQYIWRESGYVFIPGFWDWPIDDRGAIFSSVFINPNAIQTVVYEPSEALEPLYVIELLFPYWPNYYCLYRYHFYYHHDIWVSWGAAPPWWNWATWWAFPWRDIWWVWWWWSHPGYPNPSWMNEDIAKQITPPLDFVLKMMEKTTPPANVTPNGVVGNQELLNAIKKATGKDLPILPSDPKQVDQIQQLADPKTPKTPYLQPEGKRKAKETPAKPFFGPSKATIRIAPEKVAVPNRPIAAPDGVEDSYPKLFKKEKSHPNSSDEPQDEQQNVPMQASIPHSHPEILEPDQYYEQQTGPQDKTPHRPHYQPPRQGYTQNYEYPQTPMQLQHQDRLMTNPRPRLNPIEPKVYQTPGDHSTGPG